MFAVNNGLLNGCVSLNDGSLPSAMAASPSGGRFNFDDGGVYCGGWQESRAHGHGVCTGPKNMGEYSGSWAFGYEMSGVYRWANGAIYEGRWQNGKRHGVGVEYNGKWVYKGEWTQGFKGRYGVKASAVSAVKYEGTWATGLQDGYGWETYADGGYYQGQMCRGLRHGYGVRASAPYGDSQLNAPAPSSSSSTQATVRRPGQSDSQIAGTSKYYNTNDEDEDEGSESAHGGGPGAGAAIAIGASGKAEDGFKPIGRAIGAAKNGFVLVAKPLDAPTRAAASKRRLSLTNKIIGNSASSGKHSSAASGLLRKLRRQKSTGELDAFGVSNYLPPTATTAATATNRTSSTAHSDINRRAGGLSSSTGGTLQANDSRGTNDEVALNAPLALSPEELDITDAATVETYCGEWRHDKRNGHGVCDRSDGLKYEGQWVNDTKTGYGVTSFKDGTKEEGKYKDNVLIADAIKTKRFLPFSSKLQLQLQIGVHFGGTSIRQRIDDAVKLARQSQEMATKKAEIAVQRAASARDKAEQATFAASAAERDSRIAFSVARQYSDSQQFRASATSGSHSLFNSMQTQPLAQNFQGHGQQQQQIGPQPLNFDQMDPLAGARYPQVADPTYGTQQHFSYAPSQQQPSMSYNGSGKSSSQQPRATSQPPNIDADLFDHYKAPCGSINNKRALLRKQLSLDASQSPSSHLVTKNNDSLSALDQQHLSNYPNHYNMSPSSSVAAKQQQHYDERHMRRLVTSGVDLNISRPISSGYNATPTPSPMSDRGPSAENRSVATQPAYIGASSASQANMCTTKYFRRRAASLGASATTKLNLNPNLNLSNQTNSHNNQSQTSKQNQQQVLQHLLDQRKDILSTNSTSFHTTTTNIASTSGSLLFNNTNINSKVNTNVVDAAKHDLVSTGSSSQSLSLSRKASIQIKYNARELMSREEVAALSHAQREARRKLAELEELRAQRPFYCAFQQLKALMWKHKLFLSIVAFNAFVFRLARDLLALADEAMQRRERLS